MVHAGAHRGHIRNRRFGSFSPNMAGFRARSIPVGSGPHRRGVYVGPTVAVPSPPDGWTMCTVPVLNTGKAGDVPPGHPEDVSAYTNSDVYRIVATTTDAGWTTFVPRTVVSAKFGQAAQVQVFAKRAPGTRPGTRIQVTAKSESDPTKSATATCRVLGSTATQ